MKHPTEQVEIEPPEPGGGVWGAAGKLIGILAALIAVLAAWKCWR
jgi:hypothetical protein